MKKLSLIVIIAALFSFMSVGIASAKDKDQSRGGIQGTYEMIATGKLPPFPKWL
jgi:hypothetical protein